MRDIAILGASGHARDIVWLIENINEQTSADEKWNIIGFVERDLKESGEMCGYPVFQEEKLWDMDGMAVAIGVGVASSRKKATELLRKKNTSLVFPSLIAPNAIYSSRVTIGEGSLIFPGTMLMGGDVKIGKFSVVHITSTIGHDTVLGDYCQVNPGCNVSGCCVLGECVQMGTGVKILPNLTIGDNAVIGAGAVVIRDLPSDCTAVGCPARVIKQVGKD